MGDRFAAFQIDDREICVITGGEAALAGNLENAVRPVTDKIDETRERQSPFRDMIEHYRHERLHARHAGGGSRIGFGFFFKRMRRVIRPDNVEDALPQTDPQTVAMTRVADRRVHLRKTLERLVAFGRGERQMLRRHFRCCDVLRRGEQRNFIRR